LLKAEVDGAGMTREQFDKVIGIMNDIPADPVELEGEDLVNLSETGGDLNKDAIIAMASASFEKLKAANGKVPVKTFRAWEEVQTLIEDGLLDETSLASIIKEVGAKDSFDLSQFTEAMFLLDEVADDSETAEEEDDDVFRNAFDSLKSVGTGLVSKASFMAWEDVAEMIGDEFVTKDAILKVLEEFGTGAQGLDYEQFCGAIDAIDELAGTYNDDEEASEERDPNAIRDLFYELQDSKSKKVPVQLFLKWSELDSLFKEDIIDDELIGILLAEIGSSIKGDLSLDQFQRLVGLIDQVAVASKDESQTGHGDVNDHTGSQMSSPQNSEDEPSEAEVEAMTKEIFDELRGKAAKVSVKSLMAWEGVSEVLESKSGDVMCKGQRVTHECRWRADEE
jgi:hypothetical protein